VNQTQFVATFRAHLPAVSKFLTRRVERSDVEDLAADVFEIAWRKRKDCPDGMELAWLYRIAGFVVSNYRRKQQRRGFLFELTDTDNSSPSAEELALASGTIAEAFARLSTSDRQTLSLVAFEGLAVNELATALGVSANSASQRLKRARTRFANHLKDLSET
jgi:RNA polymerase sigma-70 factor (ECF subfamily)